MNWLRGSLLVLSSTHSLFCSSALRDNAVWPESLARFLTSTQPLCIRSTSSWPVPHLLLSLALPCTRIRQADSGLHYILDRVSGCDRKCASLVLTLLKTLSAIHIKSRMFGPGLSCVFCASKDQDLTLSVAGAGLLVVDLQGRVAFNSGPFNTKRAGDASGSSLLRPACPPTPICSGKKASILGLFDLSCCQV